MFEPLVNFSLKNLKEDLPPWRILQHFLHQFKKQHFKMIFFIFCRVPNLVLNKNHSTLLQAAPKQMSYPACGNLNYKPCILSDIYIGCPEKGIETQDLEFNAFLCNMNISVNKTDWCSYKISQIVSGAPIK